MERKATYNSTYKKLAVQWLIEHSTSHQHLWWLDSFVLRNRQLLVAAKRSHQYKMTIMQTKKIDNFTVLSEKIFINLNFKIYGNSSEEK